MKRRGILRTGVVVGAVLLVLLTGCPGKGVINNSDETTLPSVEISTAMEEENNSLEEMDKETYEGLDEEEKEKVISLYLARLYEAENTAVPEGEEYGEVLMSTKSAVESSLKTDPKVTMEELLNQAVALNQYKEGFSKVTRLSYEAMSDQEKDILITAILSQRTNEVPEGEAYQIEIQETKEQIEAFFEENPDQTLEDFMAQ